MPIESKPWGKIAIATRLEKQIDCEFFVIWTELIMKGLRKGDGVLTCKNKVAHHAANWLVRRFLMTAADTLFFLDSDAGVDVDFLNRFRDYEPGWQYDVLQAFYCRRGWPPEPTWMKEDVLGNFIRSAPMEDNLIENVAGVGLHATLVRREVFEDLRSGVTEVDPDLFEWFTYPRHRRLGEDVNFSCEARQAGFRVGATTALKAGHFSTVETGWDSYQEWLEISGTRVRAKAFDNLCHLVADYTGESKDLVLAKALRGRENLDKGWELHKQPRGAEALRSFLGARDNGYLYDLIQWNCGPFYQSIVAPLRNVSGLRVLVVGGGLGTEAELLAGKNKVDVFELPGSLRDFCKFRLNGQARILEGESISDALMDWREAGPYDLIVAIDTIEHVHPDEFDVFMQTIQKALKPTGALYCHSNFEEQTPMAFDHAERFEELIAANGMQKVSEYEYRKVAMPEPV